MWRRMYRLTGAWAVTLVLGTACVAGGARPQAAVPPAVTAAQPAAAAPSQQLAQITGELDLALSAARAGDLAAAKRHYQRDDDEWEEIEGGIKKVSTDVYKSIEAAMENVRVTLVRPRAPVQDASVAALNHLRQTIDAERLKLGS